MMQVIISVCSFAGIHFGYLSSNRKQNS
jgi:hypothetical protein